MAIIALATLLTAAFVAGRGVEIHNSSLPSSQQSPELTASVARGPLRDIVVGSATVQAAQTIQVRVPVLPEGTQPIVTAVLAKRGDTVSSGDVPVSIGDRPVILLSGDLPAFRPMGPGLRGPDVLQLQAELLRMGFGIPGDEEGTYGPTTARAVATLYRRNGFTPVDSASVEVAQRDSDQTGIPLGEVAFIDSLPARVSEIFVTRGKAANEFLIELWSGALTLVGTIPAVESTRVRPSDRAVVHLQGGGVLRGQVLSVDTRSADSSQSVGTARLRLRSFSPIPADMLHDMGQMTITVDRAPPDSFVVPITAVFAAADGRTWLWVIEGAAREQVPVRVELVSTGRVAVASSSAALQVGDRVLLAESGTLLDG